MQGWKSVDLQWSDMALKSSTEGESARRLLDLGIERLNADRLIVAAFHFNPLSVTDLAHS